MPRSMEHQVTGTVRKDHIDKMSDLVLKKIQRGTFDYLIYGKGNIVCRLCETVYSILHQLVFCSSPVSFQLLFAKTEKENQQPNMIRVYNHFIFITYRPYS